MEGLRFVGNGTSLNIEVRDERGTRGRRGTNWTRSTALGVHPPIRVGTLKRGVRANAAKA